ncbi:cyclic nucleotide-binding domain-containing protein [Heliobacterium gestii]|uniref:Cyclic nucleotide-binding domain-containing protein n=1 Tax=Heliomicrobium gestii TaxID=2699 RepID=A0A845LFH8_HELGE|nr:Crp/Fnr family transcriptional regulator [Heliomicrobium gestii]MBM7867426.1 CRP-like cAMP-binding protein [Heliomicrobium gestii]MZP43690.1 cyclic nucleotide-binding domain-containing protein [Heliomicrobium gestii]
MNREEILRLSACPLFNGLTPEVVKAMQVCLEPKIARYKRNDVIAFAGEAFDSIGILLTGEAQVIKETAAGHRAMMDMLRPGGLFGEIVVFSTNASWPATVIAQEESQVMFIPRRKLIGQCERSCDWHRVIIQNMLRIISEKAMMLNKKVEYLSIKSMRGKLSAFFLEQQKKAGAATFRLPMKRNELADFLNVSRPSMSREMARMREEGLIDFHLETVRIIDMEALRDRSE